MLFSDVVGFTEIAARCTPLEVCSMLNELYHTFDSAIEEFPELYKVETIGVSRVWDGVHNLQGGG